MSDEKEIQFTIDGKPVTGLAGETALAIARRHGFDIPTLCHHESVLPYGVCRLCLVEVSWGRRSKVVVSCVYTPTAGDIITTNSERVVKARRVILEFLLARCPEVDAIRDLAHKYGVDASRFRNDGDTAKSERCILCGLCVRVCREVVGRHAIGFANRGVERVVSTPFAGAAEECVGCGACVQVCPTGALHYEDAAGRRIMKEFHTEIPLARCRVCGEFFAPATLLASVGKRVSIPVDLAETCPKCRGAGLRRSMVKLQGEQA